MAAKIPLSHVAALGFDFAQAVASYRQAFADWSARPADWDPCPPPGAPHPLVVTAVLAGTYEIIDDTPPAPPPPPIEDRHQELAAKVREAAKAARTAVVPPLRRPLLELATARAEGKKWEDRTLGERELLNNNKGIIARLEAINLHEAEQLSDIADLTEDTIDLWEMIPFPEVAPDTSLPIEVRKLQLAAEVDAQAAIVSAKVLHPLKLELLNLNAAQAMATPEEKRSRAEVQALEELAAINGKTSAVKLHAAQLKADIADLTEDTIEAWQPKPFPG